MNVFSFKKIKYLFVFIFLIFTTFTLDINAVNFYSINKLFGISIRETNSVCKDDDGFIWVSSKSGILRLTNDDYRLYSLPYESANVLTVKLVYEKSKLIAYTFNGQIFIYDPVYDRFDLFFNLGNALNNNFLRIQKIALDDSGVYWIASSVGLFKYQSGKLTFIGEMTSARYSMTWYDNQHLLIAKTDGIWLFNINNSEFQQVYENEENINLSFSSLYFDKNQNKLWLGTLYNGLFTFNFDSRILSEILKSTIPKQAILAIEANSDSTILLGIDGQGVWELNMSGDRIFNVYKEDVDDTYSLNGNGVYDLFCDNYKRVWICTYSRGVSFYDQATPFINHVVHQTNEKNSLINNDINCIIEDRWGKLWFATNNGISCWDVASNRWKSYYSNTQDRSQVFLSLCEDDQGRIWAGTYSWGVYLLDAKTGKELAHYSRNNNEKLNVGNFIFEIYKDSQGDIWLGSNVDELICYQSKENKFRTYSKEPVSSIKEISGNQIILGCSYGLSFLDKTTEEVRHILEGITVADVLVEDSVLWICTRGEGFIKYNYVIGETEKFSTNSGLPSNYINSIAYANDYFWLGTESGLCRFDPKTNKVTTFLSINLLSGISYNNSPPFFMKNGQLAWSTNNGAIFFTPGSVEETILTGRIFFQDITLSGRSVREIPSMGLNTPVDSIQTLKLKYNQNNLSLDLIPISSTRGTKFSWKMENFDQEWSTPSENKLISYTNIPSGNFVLKIKLYNSSLSQVIAERSVSIMLTPPYWKRTWFFALIFIVIAGLILFYFLYYINRLKQLHTEEKVRFFTNTAHDMRTSLTLIKGPVEELGRETNLSESGRNFMQLATEQVRRLSFVVTQLMDFQKVDIGKEYLSLSMVDIVELVFSRVLMFESFAKGRNINLEFTSNRKSYDTAIDQTKIEKVVDNLISNAIKYSHINSNVYIDLKCENNKLILVVKDNGIGINRKDQRKLFKEFYRSNNAINSKIVGSGIGLLLVKNYVILHGGSINCESQENVGSTFHVVIPFKSISQKVKKLNTSIDKSPVTSQFVDVTAEKSDIKENIASKEMKILIVEDNDDLLNFMLNILNRDFKAYTAGDGVEAWEFISKHMPDLVISDILMPNMDGYELCHLMKSTYETSHIPIILLTSLSEKSEQLHGLGLGADDYLTKPFDMNLLVQRIKSIISNRVIIKEKALRLINGTTAEPILSNELNDKFVKKMLEVVKTNMSNTNFDKNEFAAEMNVSPSLLYKKTKSLTDQSPSDFIKTIRLNHSLELLKKRKYSVTEISEMCGFTSVAYFSTVFKKFFGKTPSDIL